MPTLTCIQQESKNAGRLGAKKGGGNTVQYEFNLFSKYEYCTNSCSCTGSARITNHASAPIRKANTAKVGCAGAPAACSTQNEKGEAVRKGDFLLAALDDSYTGQPGQVDYFERRRREASGEDGSRRQRTASRRSTGHSIKQPFSSAGRTRTHGFRSRLSQVHVQGQTLCSYRVRSSACLPTWSLNHLVSRRRAEFVPDR